MTLARYKYDPDTRAAYIDIDSAYGVASTRGPLAATVNLDMDKDGNLVGIELLFEDDVPATMVPQRWKPIVTETATRWDVQDYGGPALAGPGYEYRTSFTVQPDLDEGE